MATFRFRALAALELRRQQETSSATALARAEAAFREAKSDLDTAEAMRRTAQEQALTVERQGTDSHTLLWHRNWIVRLAEIVELRGREAETRSLAVRQAEQVFREARKRRLALERMRDRAWRRYQLAEQRHELKTIDELARLRFIVAEAERDQA
jgi:flagellar export protein FliJ